MTDVIWKTRNVGPSWGVRIKADLTLQCRVATGSQPDRPMLGIGRCLGDPNRRTLDVDPVMRASMERLETRLGRLPDAMLSISCGGKLRSGVKGIFPTQ